MVVWALSRSEVCGVDPIKPDMRHTGTREKEQVGGRRGSRKAPGSQNAAVSNAARGREPERYPLLRLRSNYSRSLGPGRVRDDQIIRARTLFEIDGVCQGHIRARDAHLNSLWS
jgi:hypothetical protein